MLCLVFPPFSSALLSFVQMSCMCFFSQANICIFLCLHPLTYLTLFQIHYCENQIPSQPVSFCFLAMNLLPCPGHFTVSVTFFCSLPVSSPQHLYTLCLSMSMSFSSLLELILVLIICSFLWYQPLLQQLIMDSVSLLYTASLLSEKSFMFSKITPYPCLPLSFAQSCISFSSYIITQSLSTSLMWFIECLLKSSLRRIHWLLLSKKSLFFSHIWDGR